MSIDFTRQKNRITQEIWTQEWSKQRDKQRKDQLKRTNRALQRTISSSPSKVCKDDEPISPRVAALIRDSRKCPADFDKNCREEQEKSHRKLGESWCTIL